jgi:hypothetical protein
MYCRIFRAILQPGSKLVHTVQPTVMSLHKERKRWHVLGSNACSSSLVVRAAVFTVWVCLTVEQILSERWIELAYVVPQANVPPKLRCSKGSGKLAGQG